MTNKLKNILIREINKEFTENVRDYDKGNLTYEEFHYAQRELVELKKFILHK